MSISYDIEGVVHRLFDLEVVSDRFSKREFVLEVVDGEYTHPIKFQTVNDRVSILNDIREGDMVKLSFNIRGNEYNGGFYTNLVAWRMRRIEGSFDNPVPNTTPPDNSAMNNGAPVEDDNLPF